MERHLQTAIQIILLGLIAWVGNSIVELRDSSSRLSEQVTQMQSQITEMNKRFDSYLLRTEADVRFDSQESKHNEIDRRLDVLENRRSM